MIFFFISERYFFLNKSSDSSTDGADILIEFGKTSSWNCLRMASFIIPLQARVSCSSEVVKLSSKVIGKTSCHARNHDLESVVERIMAETN